MKISGGAKITGGAKLNAGDYPRIMTAGYSTLVPGVQNLLNTSLTINGLSPIPIAMVGSQAGAGGWANYFTPANIASLMAGTSPTYGLASPFFGSLDGGVRFAGSGGAGFIFGSSTIGDWGTNDVVLEVLAYLPKTVATDTIIAKNDGTNPRWSLYLGTTDKLLLYLQDATNPFRQASSAAIPLSSFVLFHVVVKRGTYVQMYAQGALSGAAYDISSVTGSLSNSVAISIGANSNGTSPCAATIYLIQQWIFPSAIDSHIQTTIVNKRAQLLFNTRPQYWWGPYISPTSAGSSSTSYFTKEESASVTTIYQIPGGPIERYQRQIALDNRALTGVMNGGAVKNEILQSLTLGSWTTPVRCSVPATSVTCIDNVVRTTVTLHEDGTAANNHYIQGTCTITNGVSYVMSAYCKAANRTWTVLQANGKACYFQLSGNGVVGTAISCTGYIKKLGTTGWYLCWIVFTSSSTAGNPTLYVAEADNDTTFDGLNQDSLYISHVQLETGNYPSQRVDTTTVAVTKAADSYYYTLAASSLSDTEGSFLMRFLAPAGYVPLSNRFLATLSVDALTTNTVSVFIDTNGRVNVTTTSTGGGSDAGAVVEGSGTRCDGYIHEVKVTWVHNSLKLYVDNVLIGEDTVIDPPVGLNRLRVGNDAADTAGLQAGPIVVADIQAFASATNIRRVGY